MIIRVSSDKVPDEIKEKLSKLKKDIKDYVLIGDSYYEIKPFSVLKIMNIFNKFVSLINEIKSLNKEEKDYQELTGETPIQNQPVSLYDILSNEEFKNKFIEILMELFEGIDKVDFEAMNIAQFNELLSKFWEINLNAFPDEKSKQEFITKVVSLIMMINPNLYRFAYTQRFLDDLNIILSKNPELRDKINEELRKLYEERLNIKEEVNH